MRGLLRNEVELSCPPHLSVVDLVAPDYVVVPLDRDPRHCVTNFNGQRRAFQVRAPATETNEYVPVIEVG